MKKILMIVAVLALIVSTSFAQTYGVKAGLNISNLKIDGDGASASFDSKVGLTIGGFARYNFSEEFALQPELLFSQYGAKVADATMKLNYISVPVMAKYYFSGFNIQAGPQLGLLMSAKADDEDIKDGMKGMDFGFNIGAGYDFENGIGIDARYNIGLSNIAEETEDDAKLLNKGFQITLGYAF